jgi:steroid 5-alpha reductase family enzyme
VLLVGLWSVRMALHIGIRNAGHGKEDGRYAAWRKRFGGNWWWWSFFQVFMMQGVTVWLWSLGLIGAVAAGTRDLGWQHGLAVALFVVGFYFQVRGDAQLAHFKRTRTDRSMVLDTGLWSLTRHPNYFGESVLWWSFGALGLVHPWGWLALVCPLYVTWFMRTGSATPMQERYLAKTKPAYADYMRRVPRFFPWGKPK